MRRAYSSGLDPPAMIVPVRVCRLGSTELLEVEGLIDTGADASVIPDALRRRLGLRPGGVGRLCSVGDAAPRQCPTFRVTVSVGDLPARDLVVFAAWEDYFLIGRDLLNELILHADGPARVFELTRPPGRQ